MEKNQVIESGTNVTLIKNSAFRCFTQSKYTQDNNVTVEGWNVKINGRTFIFTDTGIIEITGDGSNVYRMDYVSGSSYITRTLSTVLGTSKTVKTVTL